MLLPAAPRPAAAARPPAPAPPATTTAPPPAAIHAATASDASLLAEEQGARDTLALLASFFRRPDGDGPPADDSTPEPGLQQLQEMGFSEMRSRRALLFARGDTAAAMEWILQQDFDDVGLEAPLSEAELASATAQRATFMPDVQVLQQLVGMGFALGKVLLALRACDNREDKALVWLFAESEQPHPTEPADRAICCLCQLLSGPEGGAGLGTSQRVLQSLASLATGDGDAASLLEDHELGALLRRVAAEVAR